MLLSFQERFAPAVIFGLMQLNPRQGADWEVTMHDLRTACREASVPGPHVLPHPKRQTIRAWRKRPFRKGDTLHMYVRPRQPTMYKLGEATCEQAWPIKLDEEGAWLVLTSDVTEAVLAAWHAYYLCIGHWEAEHAACLNRFARMDGFSDWADMRAWFDETHGLPFRGQLITW